VAGARFGAARRIATSGPITPTAFRKRQSEDADDRDSHDDDGSRHETLALMIAVMTVIRLAAAMAVTASPGKEHR
jgi:hypothetical protein